jgi:predicted Zn-dependent peptidase
MKNKKSNKRKYYSRRKKLTIKQKYLGSQNSKITILENEHKTRLIFLPKRNESRSASIFFYFKVGSKNEPENLQGISHFIEHMVFKGSPKYPFHLDISKTFDANGISFNAFTSKEMTAYHFKFLSSSENMNLICSITHDMVFNPFMREKDIKPERNVIIQEMKDGEDDIDDWINDKLEQCLLQGHPLSNPIIGNLKTLYNINRQELINYHNKYYQPHNLVIALSGNIQPEYLHIINKFFNNSTKISKTIKSKSSKFKEISLQTQGINQIIPYIDIQPNQTIQCFKKDLKQDYLFIIFKTRGRFDPLRNHYKLLANILGGNMSSRLFVKIREQLGLVYSIKCSLTSYEEIGYFSIITQNENKTTIDCLKNIFLELDKFKAIKIGDAMFEKEVNENKKNWIDTYITYFDDIEYENEYFAKQVIFNQPLESIQTRIDKIRTITTNDLLHTANELFNYNKMHIITFGKITESQIKSTLPKTINNH